MPLEQDKYMPFLDFYGYGGKTDNKNYFKTQLYRSVQKGDVSYSTLCQTWGGVWYIPKVSNPHWQGSTPPDTPLYNKEGCQVKIVTPHLI